MSRWRNKFDEQQLRRLIRTMTRRSKIYAVLRDELKRLGRWKNLPRGKPYGITSNRRDDGQ